MTYRSRSHIDPSLLNPVVKGRRLQPPQFADELQSRISYLWEYISWLRRRCARLEWRLQERMTAPMQELRAENERLASRLAQQGRTIQRQQQEAAVLRDVQDRLHSEALHSEATIKALRFETDYLRQDLSQLTGHHAGQRAAWEAQMANRRADLAEREARVVAQAAEIDRLTRASLWHCQGCSADPAHRSAVLEAQLVEA